jgi:Na+-translocating ferredoxin:NAD+ oxidoreductase RnfC subunit
MASAKEIAFQNGVVGAGGAGFPSYVKLSSVVDFFIVNAAECEPLLYKDEEILRNFFEDFKKGVLSIKECVKAKKCFIGIKEKHIDLIDEIKSKLPDKVEIFLLKDTYPSGDEFLLVYDVTGRAIPKGGIPLDVGVLVQNVETVYNIGREKPVIEKFVTISGDVDESITLKVPIGISFLDVVGELKINVEGKKFIIGGPMMGYFSPTLDIPVTKCDSGVVILPENHPLIFKKSRNKRNIEKIAYTCDQCTRCSDLCPRDLLGHDVKPHKAMISVSMSLKEKTPFQISSLYCCECGLCSLYSCPEELDPSNVMILSKRKLFEEGERPQKINVEPSPLYDYRRTPTKLLIRRLGLEDYLKPHRFIEREFKPKVVSLKLNQHRGEIAKPVVKKGDRIKKGEVVAKTEEGKMGSRIFSSIDGVVKELSKDAVVIENREN